MTATKAQALATAGVLTSKDLSGYIAKPQTHTATDAADDRRLEACLGIPGPKYLARNFGTKFTKGNLEIDSSADVASSVADATTQYQAITSSKAPSCLKSSLGQVLARVGATAQSFSAKLVPVTVAGADKSFAYQLSVKATAQGHAFQLAGLELGILVGQVEIDVTALATGPTSFTANQATALAATAASRVRAAT